MKRAATWLLYIVGAASLAYLALYAYALWRGDPLQPGEPIKIFRKDNAPSYSAVVPGRAIWRALGTDNRCVG